MSSFEPIRIVEDVFHLQAGPNMVNAGFIVTTDGVIVVDSGPSPKAALAIQAAIRQVTDQPVAYVINTHFHSSHTFGNQSFGVPAIGHVQCRVQMERAALKDWSPAEIARWCEQDKDAASELDGFRVVVPSICFSGNGFLHIGDKVIHLVPLGNHTPDSVAVFLPEQRVVFAGDNLISGRHPFLRHANAAQWVDVLRHLDSLKFDHAVPGHGKLMDRRDVYNLRVYFEMLLKAPRHRKGPIHLERIAQV